MAEQAQRAEWPTSVSNFYVPMERSRPHLAVGGKADLVVGESRTRGHGLRIGGKLFRTEVRRNFFTQRVVNV